jgi:hypothetical protein
VHETAVGAFDVLEIVEDSSRTIFHKHYVIFDKHYVIFDKHYVILQKAFAERRRERTRARRGKRPGRKEESKSLPSTLRNILYSLLKLLSFSCVADSQASPSSLIYEARAPFC